MQRPRMILAFAIRLVVLYALLILPWLRLGELFASIYRGAVNATAASFGTAGVVRFVALPGPHEADVVPAPGMDTQITIHNRRTGVTGTTPHSSRMTGYLPNAVAAALILATPLPLRRRLVALAWGLVWVNLFVASRVAITLFYWFSADGGWALYHPGPILRSVLKTGFELWVVAPTCTFLVPALIWLMVVHRERGGLTLQQEEGDAHGA